MFLDLANNELNSGKAEACHELSKMYRNGHYFSTNYDVSDEYYDKAWKLGCRKGY